MIKTTPNNQGDDALKKAEQLKIEASMMRDAYFQLKKTLVLHRKTELELKKSEEKYRNLITTSLDIIQSVDPNGKFVFVNSVWEKVLGYSGEEAKNMDMFKIIDPSSLEHCKKIFAEVMSGKAAKDIEAIFVTKDGRKINIRGNAAPIIVDGRVIATHGFFRDVTETMVAEKKIRESEKKYRTLANNIPGMIYRAKPDWSTEIISNSEAICGYLMEEFYSGRINWSNLIHSDDKKRIYEESGPITKKQLELKQEYRILHKNGEVRWVIDYKTSLFEGNTFLGVDGIVFDISDSKKIEENLKLRTIEAEKLNKLTVGREVKMVELKKRIEELESKLGGK